MFFEHTINHIVSILCFRKGIEGKVTADIIRNVNIAGKFSWLLLIFGIKPLKKEHVNTILKVADERNAFVHYKWSRSKDWGNTIDDDERDEQKEQEFFKKIKLAVAALKRYESKIFYDGKKGKVRKIARISN